jgi:hypothetical protein
MSELKPVDPLALVRAALGELQSACGQSRPSDDQIIIGHIRSAITLLWALAYPDVENDRRD